MKYQKPSRSIHYLRPKKIYFQDSDLHDISRRFEKYENKKKTFWTPYKDAINSSEFITPPPGISSSPEAFEDASPEDGEDQPEDEIKGKDIRNENIIIFSYNEP